MDYSLLFVLFCVFSLAILAVVFLTSSNFFEDGVIGIFVAFVAGFILIGFLKLAVDTFEGDVALLEVNKIYVFQSLYKGEGAAILELNTKITSGYHYKIICSNFRGGCPEQWPKKFKIIKDQERPDEKLIIVDMANAGSGGSM